eukprot:663271-Prymnesium_polylepis.1
MCIRDRPMRAPASSRHRRSALSCPVPCAFLALPALQPAHRAGITQSATCPHLPWTTARGLRHSHTVPARARALGGDGGSRGDV